jgi:16S rRNA (cytosine967-C5)-methyltransferase
MALQSARELALAALSEWRDGRKFADAILSRQLRSTGLIAADRAFATELLYGVLRNLTLLDFWIGSLRRQHLEPDARDLLRLGLYQLFVLDTPQHAAVYETVALAGAKRRSLVNAILRTALRRKGELLEKAGGQDLSIRSSHPQFLIDRWTKSFGTTNTAALCEWDNQPAPIYARINQLKISRAEFLAEAGSALCADRPPQPDIPANFVRLANLPSDALGAGHCYIQDPSTATACLLLDPQPGERVLDACAAPGGKTGYLAELMKNEGLILACDRDAHRIATLQDNLDRLGVRIARCVRRDWTSSDASDKPQLSSFDRILADAPCSNTGVMRRRVDLRWRLSPKDFSRMQNEQFRILRAVIPLLKLGGSLVYSTCSVEPEENEQVTATILREFPFLQLIEEKSLLPFRDGVDGAYAAKLARRL